ncbi:MAG: type II methionyl aminopeptidase [Candidatus Parvarchaeum sp.]
MEKEEKEKWLLAGKIGKEIRELGISLCVPGARLLDIAEAIEKRTLDRGAKPSFPPNISINQIAAHYTPKYDDKTELKKGDIVKIDVGASVDGYLSDTAASVSVGESENKLVSATKEALDSVVKMIKPGMAVSEISTVIDDKITSFGFSPIVNLGGHGIGRYSLHEGEFISNSKNYSGSFIRKEGVVAVEPFATNGSGYVIDSAEVQIYQLIAKKSVRSALGREILKYISEEYNQLPFAKRWIINKFGKLAEIEMKNLVATGTLHEFNVLKEKENGLVSQFEHSFLFDGSDVVVTTL